MEHSLVKFKYEVRIGTGACFLKSSKLGETFDRLEEMVIYSKPFNSYAECQQGLNGVMTYLSRAEAKAAKKSHVIVSKPNPMMDDSGKKHADLASWDKFTLVRAYVADSEKLKSSQLTYHVLGQIISDHEIQVAFQA